MHVDGSVYGLLVEQQESNNMFLIQDSDWLSPGAEISSWAPVFHYYLRQLETNKFFSDNMAVSLMTN